MSDTTTPLRDVLVVWEDGPHPAQLMSIDHVGGNATVIARGADGWQSVPSWTVVDPPYDMLTNRADILAQIVDLAADDARRMSNLDVTVLTAYYHAAGDGLTNDGLHRRLKEADVSEFDQSITPKVVADHLAADRIEVLPVPERSRHSRREPAHVRRITGLGRLAVVQRRLARVPS